MTDVMITSCTPCPKCGHLIQEGDWPFCPRGGGPHERRGNYSNHRDEIPGGITLENYGSEPVTFYSHSERLRYLADHGLQQKETFCPFPGTDTDPAGVMNPLGYVDEQTLANGAALMLRAAGADRDWDPIASGLMRNITTIHGTEKDAIAVASGDEKRSARVGRRLNAS